MTGKDRVKCALKHEEPDMVPKYDWPWDSTIKRWQDEGLGKDISVPEFFNFDIEIINADNSPQFEKIIIEEDEEYVIKRTEWGEIVKNHKNYSTTPLLIDNPIKNKKDWQMVKEMLSVNKERLKNSSLVLRDYNPDSKTIRSWENNLNEYKNVHNKGKFIFLLSHIGTEPVQSFLGSPKYLEMMVTEPELLKEMYIFMAKFSIEVYEYYFENGLNFIDGIFLGNDMGYKNGLLFSPTMYKELIFPGDKLICDYFHNLKIPVTLHRDGDIRKLIPLLIEAGFDCLQPLEVKASMDVRNLKNQYGDKLCFMGGIDARLMSNNDLLKIEEEIRTKFEIAKKNGGYIYHSDHSIPNNVSLDQFKSVMELVDKYGKY